MPSLPVRKGPAASLVQDQDIYVAEAAKADLTITVIGAAENSVKHVTDIHVSSDLSKRSVYLRALIDESDDKSEITYGEGAKSNDDGDNRDGILVWLAHLHSLTHERMNDLGLFRVSLLGVWYSILLWQMHQDANVKDDLQNWFQNWYDTSMAGADLNPQIAQALAFPCYLFDHAVGYARVTKYLAYHNIGHVKERPPKGFKGGKHLHIDQREFVGPLNHARGGLRNTLHKSLYSRIGRLLRSETDSCSCWDATIGRYQYALTKCEAWPVDDVLNYSSISQVVRRLNNFNYNFTPQCKRCRGIDFESIVLRARSNTENYFHGMCMDCMNRSNPRGEELDDEYEEHNQSVGGRWATRCRIKHGQPTWYISWLGLPDMREKILRGPDGYRAPEEE